MKMLLTTCDEARDTVSNIILKDTPKGQLTLGESSKSGCISLRSSKYLINLMASPCRMVDGAVVIVNYEEGICDNIADGLRRAVRNKIQLALIINNIDMGFELDGEEIYSLLLDIVNQVNAIIREHRGPGCTEDSDCTEVCPVRGTVGFSFGANDYAFTLSQFAGKDCVVEKLWGNNYYDSKLSKWHLKKTRACKSGFVHLCYGPIKKDIKNFPFPSDKMLINMIVSKLPSPPMAQKYRAKFLYLGDTHDPYGKGITNCDLNGPLMVYASKIVPDNKKLVLARVFSGTMCAGMTVRFIGTNVKIGEEKGPYTDSGTQHLCTDIVRFRDGRKSEVHCGNLVVIELSGLLKTADVTITGEKDMMVSPLTPSLVIKMLVPEERRDRKVGLIWDERMISGHVPNSNDQEIPQRVSKIMELLRVKGLMERCKTMRPSKSATLEDVALVHEQEYISLIKNICALPDIKRKKQAKDKFVDLYLSEKTYETALLAAGAVIEVAEKVIKQELDSAFAIVRPPGHHAEADKGMGFCVFNNIAVAASVVLDKRVNKILIVDWDIHHGNGTQKTFLDSTDVLVFNVHRYNEGKFYPSTTLGSLENTGTGKAKGFNVNVPLDELGYCDADYTAIWDHVLIPIAKSFDPDLILISGGFDAAKGDPLGGCCVTPDGFSLMLRKLMTLAGGRIVIVLEGGYSLEALPKSVCATVETLLSGVPMGELSSNYSSSVKVSTWQLIQEVCFTFKTHWPILVCNEEIARLNKKLALAEENKNLKNVMRQVCNQFLELSGGQENME